MKNLSKVILSVLILFLGANIMTDGKTHVSLPHYETATFKVYGNCDLCKERIESAVLESGGVQSAVWNKETKLLTVVYNPHKLTLQAIHQRIADAGHDTDSIMASDEIYNSISACCTFERPTQNTEEGGE